MFTGIVSAVGKIVQVTPFMAAGDDAGVHLKIHAPGFSLENTQLGDSIAVQGACMTVVDLDRQAGNFSVDVSRESLDCTVGLASIGDVNLEHALRLGDSLDGHLVSGHVDGLGEVTCFEPAGESWELHINVPRELARYLAYKGSITVNGVSLTVNRVDDHASGCEIRINLIPHTVQVTTLKQLACGAFVNLEIDMIARYVERIMSASNPGLRNCKP